MTFEWTAHRFSGGALAFDLANTVVCRNQPAKRIDRLARIEETAAFADAAGTFCAGETGVQFIFSARTDSGNQVVLRLREAIDVYFRALITTGAAAKGSLATLFAAAADASKDDQPSGNLGVLASLSAMRLLNEKMIRRSKICPNCDWIFVDRSKNQSRLWCDMAKCGNRNKAKLHYSKQRLNGKAIADE